MKRKSALRFKTTLCMVIALLMTIVLVSTQAVQAYTTPDIPAIEGPIITSPTYPDPMWPGLVATPSTTTPLEDYGYTADEYFISGTASGQPYKTRILVRHPVDPQKFSGIVVAEIMHTNGTSVTFGPARVSIMLRGHIHIEIAAVQSNVNTTLKGYNPTRYASLSILSSSQLSDIVAQVGTLIKTNGNTSPLYPSFARHLFLQGTSAASASLRTYQANAHFQYRLADGSPIFDGYFATSTLGQTQMMKVDVPTVQMPTMTEVRSGAATGNQYRRPDGDDPANWNQFRTYEVAGMAHANSRDTVTYAPNHCNLPVSDFPWGAMAAMGLNNLVEWVDKGTVPPPGQFIGVVGGAIELDSYGNAIGGVRNPYVDVPVDQYGVPNSGSGTYAFTCSIAGYEYPLPQATLDALYKNRGQYISQINQDLIDLIRAGYFLPEYADMVRSDAQVASKTLIKPQK